MKCSALELINQPLCRLANSMERLLSEIQQYHRWGRVQACCELVNFESRGELSAVKAGGR
jgi:hypothetical protein